MWVVRGDRLLPLLPLSPEDAPWHSQQMAALPAVYVQNASLEIAWTRVVHAATISGTVMLPFFTEGDEGLDINRPKDLVVCRAADRARRSQPAARRPRSLSGRSSSRRRVKLPYPEGLAVGDLIGSSRRIRALLTFPGRNSSGCAAQRRPRGRGRALCRHGAAQRALHDRAGGLRPYRLLLLRARHRQPALSRRDRASGDDLFFSSKGHDAPGLYAVLIGLEAVLPEDRLHVLRRLDGLPGHPDVVHRRARHQHRLARHGHLQGQGHADGQPARRPAPRASS